MAQFDLALAASKLMTLLVNQMQELGVVMPARVYIAPGIEVPHDCEQFTLHMTRIFSNKAGMDSPAPTHHALLMNSVEFTATMVRCVPVQDEGGTLPSPAEVTAASGVLLEDARAIRRSFEMIEQQHLFTPRNVPVSIGDVVPTGPSGAVAAVAGTFAFQMVDQDWVWDSPGQAPLWEEVQVEVGV